MLLNMDEFLHELGIVSFWKCLKENIISLISRMLCLYLYLRIFLLITINICRH